MSGACNQGVRTAVLGRSDKRKNVRRLPGQIVRIDLGDGLHGYGLVLREPLIAFFDKPCAAGEACPDEIANLPVAFTLMVMNDAVTKGRWPVAGRTAIPPGLEAPPRFCLQDSVTGKLSIYHEVPELAPHYERPARTDECRGLEAAAVWEPEHVEDRLRDYFAGRPNQWVEQLKPRIPDRLR